MVVQKALFSVFNVALPQTKTYHRWRLYYDVFQVMGLLQVSNHVDSLMVCPFAPTKNKMTISLSILKNSLRHYYIVLKAAKSGNVDYEVHQLHSKSFATSAYAH